jgi:hypothetical protein
MYAGADWIRKTLKIPLSPLGERVADLLGDVCAGIYHLDPKALKRAKWDDTRSIEISLDCVNLATFDGSILTHLVILAHDACVRLEIDGRRGPRGGVVLTFHAREGRAGRLWTRHPTIEQAVANVRAAQAAGTFRTWTDPIPACETSHAK